MSHVQLSLSFKDLQRRISRKETLNWFPPLLYRAIGTLNHGSVETKSCQQQLMAFPASLTSDPFINQNITTGSNMVVYSTCSSLRSFLSPPPPPPPPPPPHFQFIPTPESSRKNRGNAGYGPDLTPQHGSRQGDGSPGNGNAIAIEHRGHGQPSPGGGGHLSLAGMPEMSGQKTQDIYGKNPL